MQLFMTTFDQVDLSLRDPLMVNIKHTNNNPFALYYLRISDDDDSSRSVTKLTFSTEYNSDLSHTIN